MSAQDILRVRNLSTRYFTDDGQINAVSNLSVDIQEGEVFGIVGESGSGKSVTARSVMGLIESPGRITEGEVWYRDPDIVSTIGDKHPDAIDGDFVNLRALPTELRNSFRGTKFSMIFQDPESSFNPSLTVGEQIAEAVEVQRRASANPRTTRARTDDYSLLSYLSSTVVPSRRYVSSESKKRAIELLDKVGIPDPAERAQEYPHEYSGGMLQRAMIAQAIAGDPDLLIADEPTTALDVTIQAQVLNILRELQEETGMTILLITHNLGVIARMCDRVGVMYAGQFAERGTLREIFEESVHPYTNGLLGSVPDLEDTTQQLQPIPGNVPSLIDAEMPDRCYFADRCPKAMEKCLSSVSEHIVDKDSDHTARCVLAQGDYDPAQAVDISNGKVRKADSQQEVINHD